MFLGPLLYLEQSLVNVAPRSRFMAESVASLTELQKSQEVTYRKWLVSLDKDGA